MIIKAIIIISLYISLIGSTFFNWKLKNITSIIAENGKRVLSIKKRGTQLKRFRGTGIPYTRISEPTPMT